MIKTLQTKLKSEAFLPNTISWVRIGKNKLLACWACKSIVSHGKLEHCNQLRSGTQCGFFFTLLQSGIHNILGICHKNHIIELYKHPPFSE